MSEMRSMDCPACQTDNQPISAVDGIREYRCRGCGMVYYGPCGCDVVYDTAAEAEAVEAARPALHDDWAMSPPKVDVLDASSATAYPGCS
jgi:hypothetical protein